jgi:L-alanine-DL-glutamate epimerase-like enolase superfamily enzyme
MVGCMLESSLAISAGALIGTTAKYADLDGHVLLKEMPFSQLKTNNDFAISLSDLAGLGVELESSLAKYELS